ncbi:hypothetical protein FRC00_008386 [Tulasnella sp. 408]|nr:hypothetical protein FRC00_008386 [Tulasnella sp. 408]
MSAAASCDPAPHTRDWYVELLIVFAIMVYNIAETRSQISVPRVVHVLWTESSQIVIQTSAEQSDSNSYPSAPPTPKAGFLPLQTSSESSGSGDCGSAGSSTIQNILEPSATSAQPGSNSARLIIGLGPALGSVRPSGSAHFDDLKVALENDVDQALRNLNPSPRDQIMEKINKLQEHKSKDNMGKCAETFPYLCIVCGGLSPRKVYGLAFEPYKLRFKAAKEALSATPLNATTCLHFLHYFGFKKACKVCCILMNDINVHYIQYHRREENLQPYLRAYPTVYLASSG